MFATFSDPVKIVSYSYQIVSFSLSKGSSLTSVRIHNLQVFFAPKSKHRPSSMLHGHDYTNMDTPTREKFLKIHASMCLTHVSDMRAIRHSFMIEVSMLNSPSCSDINFFGFLNSTFIRCIQQGLCKSKSTGWKSTRDSPYSGCAPQRPPNRTVIEQVGILISVQRIGFKKTGTGTIKEPSTYI